MIRLPGILKIFEVFLIDFFAVYALFHNIAVAAGVVGVIALYVWLGGFFALLRDGGVRS